MDYPSLADGLALPYGFDFEPRPDELRCDLRDDCVARSPQEAHAALDLHSCERKSGGILPAGETPARFAHSCQKL
jgi:hypothetical protein